jgi:hypothetical protein
MTDNPEQIPTPEEIRCAEEKAVRCGFLKSNADGTYTITDAGKDWVEAWILSSPTLH